MINCDLNCVEPTSSDLVPRPLKKRMVSVLTTQPILQNRRLNLIMPKKQNLVNNSQVRSIVPKDNIFMPNLGLIEDHPLTSSRSNKTS